MDKDIALIDEKHQRLFLILVILCITKNIADKAKLSWYQLLNDKNEINDSEISTLLFKLKDACNFIIKPNQKLYRARPYKNSEMKNLCGKPYWKELFNNLSIEDTPNSSKQYLPFFDKESILEYIPFFKEFDVVKDILNTWITKYKDEKFWGFDAKGSGRNYTSTKEGRLNKAGEHHLYLAYDVNTAISEIRPINQQRISVATINIKKELKMFDLTKTFELGDGTKDGDYFAFYQIVQMCSMPNFNDNTYYKPTQKISSYIKELGFDGIIYPSALKENGKNILIFEFDNSYMDNEYFEVLSSDVYIATNEIKVTKILPMEI